MATKIIVRSRSNDYHAKLAGNAGVWGCGPTPEAAVRDVIRSWPEKFRTTVEIQQAR